jgi:hypothetical protein
MNALPPTLHGPRVRRGVSLLEVMISMGILLFGLLGVGAMVPLGRMSIVAATKADRSAACGRAVLRTVRLGRMLDVNNWIGANGTKIAASPASAIPTSFCIDPVMVAKYGASVNAFPAVTGATAAMQRGIAAWPQLLPTATVPTPAPPTAPQANSPPCVSSAATAAARIFTASDDLRINVPDDRQIRPTRLFQTTTGVWNTGNVLAGQFEGNYSCMVTITPSLPETIIPSPTPSAMGGAAQASLTDRRLYVVSVVVFYGRDTSLPNATDTSSERVATIASSTYNNAFLKYGGYGGGSVLLQAPTGDASPGDMLAVKPDEWVLLCANLQGAAGTFPFFRWYRIVSIGDVSGTSRYAMLAGPDWPTGSIVAGSSPQVVLMRGVVGVYSDILELEGDGLWNK